ncbi:MAG: anaerobic carbon-monoxide dehydrogenase catalytic subunit, partial [Actinomycetota bacterium]|nr:anaerobic carbon-monoxide dehydrogenase catalytic subunit [Actinomycetota bacterium]
ARRVAAWRQLGIMPGGVNAEIRTALVKCMTSVNNDPVDLLLTAMKLSIANAYAGLHAINRLQDILMGGAGISGNSTNLGVLDPATVNIVAHGHQPLLASLVTELAGSEEFAQKAAAAGAAGIKVYGSMCEGQELFQRDGGSTTFAGQLGNWLHQEFALGTGAVDLVMMDYNCSIPSLPEYAERFSTRLVTTDPAVRMSGVERLEHTPETAGETAREILRQAVAAFSERGEVNIPEESQSTIAGFSAESVVAALGGSVQPLVDAIAAGSIRGIAAVVGCTTAGPEARGDNIIGIAERLIASDILVVTGGCTSSTLQNAGFTGTDASGKAGPGLKAVCESLGVPPVLSFGSCTDIGRIADVAAAVADVLDVDISELPVAVSAPEWLEQKAVADAFFSVAYGLFTHLSPVPPVTGSELVTRVLTQDVEGLTGGKVAVEDDPETAATMIARHIEDKRQQLGLS